MLREIYDGRLLLAHELAVALGAQEVRVVEPRHRAVVLRAHEAEALRHVLAVGPHLSENRRGLRDDELLSNTKALRSDLRS